MKAFITPCLLRFSLAAVLLAILFRYFLSHGIESHITVLIVLVSFLYGVGMFSAGWYFGKKDAELLPIFDVGFRFHLATYLVHNVVSELWFVGGFNSEYEKASVIHVTALCWGIFLLLHLAFYLRAREQTIRGLHKHDLFE